MLDIRSLERRWLKYKIKSYAPYIIGIFVIILLISLLPYIWLNDKNSESTSKANHFFSPAETPPPAQKSQVGDSSNILEPSMNFVQTFQTSAPETPMSSVSSPQNTKSIQQAVPVPKVLNIPESTPLKAPPLTSTVSADKPIIQNHNESKLDIESVARRFKDTSNPSLGLFVARYHYDHGNYNEAYNFALKTNSINNNIDESWIIFSKSLVKLGKVEQAKKTLQAYIGESNSESARSLLDSIERGTFK